jgi:hypothetical protein
MKTLLLFLCLFLQLPPTTLASETFERGSISVVGMDQSLFPDIAKLTLVEVITLVSKKFEGKIVEVALESENDFLVFEVELFTKDRKKLILFVDAGTGEILRSIKKEKL